MPRTTLFSSLRRALAVTRHASRTGIPAAELLEQSISRRSFIGTSTALVTAAALSGCTTSSARSKNIVIVGGGIAGLVAAYRLQQAGLSPRIFEASNRVGGRMYSIRNAFADGQVAELGGELIDTNHESIRALAVELGIELDDLREYRHDLEQEVFWFDGRRLEMREIVEAFAPVAAAIDRDLSSITGDDVTFDAPNNAENLDRVSIAEWLDRQGVDGWFRRLLDVGYTTEYGLEIDRQSSMNLLYMISTTPEPFEIFGDSDERFHTRGGNDLFVSELSKRLDSDVFTNHVLESVRQRPDGSYALSFRHGETTRDVAAGHVVLTLPFTRLREVELAVGIPDVQRRAITELGYGTNAKLMIGFSDRVWTRHDSAGAILADLPFQLCWETSRMQPGLSGILTNFSGGGQGIAVGQGSAEEQAHAVVASLERAFPGIGDARAGQNQVRFHWPSHPQTGGSYASYLAGQWTAIRGAEGLRTGNLHFAGEHTSLDFQGFMNGGCESGERAAREILEG
jgi:monoamine oxidase